MSFTSRQRRTQLKKELQRKQHFEKPGKFYKNLLILLSVLFAGLSCILSMEYFYMFEIYAEVNFMEQTQKIPQKSHLYSHSHKKLLLNRITVSFYL
jgi:Mg2+/citrate symporter